MSEKCFKRLSIVIPAYNEEGAIESIISRTLAASPVIVEKTLFQSVEVIVVNDGSRDRTHEIASRYAKENKIQLVSYEKNKGYGAAIKQGFDVASGDVLGFLDADGTCDPLFFIDLGRKMSDSNADIVIGSRLGPTSKMPLTRRIGNIAYRMIVNAIGDAQVSDIASGMRLIKRSSLRRLNPLPDGLHFTPAMSVRAILDRDIRIEEVPMPYEERVGKSKLSVVRDGMRFLRVIFETAFTYKPFRLFGAFGLLLLLMVLVYGAAAVYSYATEHRIPEYMIYRLLFVLVAGTTGLQLLSLGSILQSIVNLVHRPHETHLLFEKLLSQTFLNRLFLLGVVFVLGGILLNAETIREYVTTGHIHVHWVYIVAGGFLVLTGGQFFVFSLISRVMRLLKDRKAFLDGEMEQGLEDGSPDQNARTVDMTKNTL